MSQMIGIVDYGYAGNVYNIKKALETIDRRVSVVLLENEKVFRGIDKIILPGVGAFKDAMLGIAGLKAALHKHAQQKPIMGICLGMQILAQKGYEFGETVGLSIVEGEVMRLPVKCRVPHLGWATLDFVKPSRILKGVSAKEVFYYMHSYELINYKDGVALSRYCEHSFIAAVEKENIYGVQFHPEKSREAGLKVLGNFIAL